MKRTLSTINGQDREFVDSSIQLRHRKGFEENFFCIGPSKQRGGM